MLWSWGAAAALALLWPDRLSGGFDGVPLDRIPEAIVVGAAFPLLWALAPRVLRMRAVQALIVALVAWRAASAVLLVRDGWCVRFEPSRPYAKDGAGAPHAWDFRADWRDADPRCSAIMTRQYFDFHDFPAWFFNLPPDNDSWPGPLDRPPGAVVTMTVTGFLRAPSRGRLRIEQEQDTRTELLVDDHPAPPDEELAAGLHMVAVRTTLTGDRWRFVTSWNGQDVWAQRLATVDKPSRLDVFARQWLFWLPATLVVVLIGAWMVCAVADIGSAPVLAWTIAASAAMAILVAGFDRADLGREATIALAGAALVPVPPRWRNWRGVLLLIGVPWLTFVVSCAAPAIGRFVIYDWGHDYWMFQRYAYRIVMQGYWLEGGSPTFWFQPLYRWIAGLLHAAFGDSSAGEWYWDGACLLAGSVFAGSVVRAHAGFRWGVAAAVLPLATFTWGTAQYLIGRGLGEISSAGFVYVAALFAIRARGGNWRAAAAAGLFATLAFYTRLNNLIMALGVIVFAVPAPLSRRRWWREAAIIAAVVAAGVLLFAWRTWHYTGVFSVFYGTQRDLLAIRQPGMRPTTVIAGMLDSVWMVLSVNDPARFDVYALPVLAGAAVAVLAALRVPRLSAVPPRLVLFFLASIAGAFIARGSAYPGRFSVHVIPIACALAVCGAAALRPGSHQEATRQQQVL